MSSTINPEVADCVNNMTLNAIRNQNNELTNELERLNKKVLKNISPDTIKTKIKNITKAGVSQICGTKRCSKSDRCIIKYSDVTNSNLSLDDLKLFKNGITVLLVNDDYFKIFEKDDSSKSELDKYLISNIGSDNNISSLIVIIKENGDSGSNNLYVIYNKIKPIIDENNWIPVQRKDIEIPHGQTNKTNEYWEGHYYIDISGGSNNNKIQSHKEDITKYQLFIDICGYMDEKIGVHTTSALIFQLLYCHNILDHLDINKEKLDEFKDKYSNILSNILYDDGNILDWCNKFIKDNKLICPLQAKFIDFEYFMKENKKDPDYIQICHNEAMSKHIYKKDKINNVILSDFRPRNMFWGTLQGNMEQQTMTINEFHEYRKSVILRQNEYFSNGF